MLKRISIRKLLFFGFSLIIAAFIGIAAYIVFVLENVETQSNKMYDHPFVVSKCILQMKAGQQSVTLDALKLFTDQAESQSVIINRIRQSHQSNEGHVNLVTERYLGDPNDFSDFIKKYRSFYEHVELGIAKKKDNGNVSPSYLEELSRLDLNFRNESNGIIEFADAKAEELNESISDYQSGAYFALVLAVLIAVTIIILLMQVVMKRIVARLEETNKMLEDYAKGEFGEDIEVAFHDEIGDVFKGIRKMVDNIQAAALFAEKTGDGKLEYEYEAASENDMLGNALLNMRKQLQEVAEEDRQRNWITKGLAQFSDLLRNTNSDIHEFGFKIISELIKYVDANQGGIFLLHDATNDKERYLELIGFYAYERRKYMNKEVKPGQGLVGQCLLEGKKIYMTDVPQDYIHVKSGLGDAPPRSVLIVPLIVNDKIQGVIEMASFNEFNKYQIEFIDKLSESIAATFSSIKVNLETKLLLEESQEMQEMMKQQEEELKQQTEEITATTETMQQEIEERERKIEQERIELKSRLNVLNEMCLVSETNKKGEIEKVNDLFVKVSQYSRKELVGKPHNVVRHPDMPSALFKKMWATIGRGETFRGLVKNRSKDGTAYWVDAVIVPKKGKDGKPDGYLGVRYEITKTMQRLDSYTYDIDGEKFTIPIK